MASQLNWMSQSKPPIWFAVSQQHIDMVVSGIDFGVMNESRVNIILIEFKKDDSESFVNKKFRKYARVRYYFFPQNSRVTFFGFGMRSLITMMRCEEDLRNLCLPSTGEPIKATSSSAAETLLTVPPPLS